MSEPVLRPGEHELPLLWRECLASDECAILSLALECNLDQAVGSFEGWCSFDI